MARRRTAMHAAGWLTVLFVGSLASVGCGSNNKAEAPAQFSANPTGPPTSGGDGSKPAGKQKERGPATKDGDS
jgi:hypothetical protein